MADLLMIVIFGTVIIIGICITIALAYLLIRYLDERRNKINYVESEYMDLINTAINNCPESIFGFDLRLATTKYAEGRSLGIIKGYLNLQVSSTQPKKDSEEQEIEEEDKKIKPYRHHIVFLPKNYKFNILNPSTWDKSKNLKVALIEDSEIPEGLNGNIRWESAGIDYFKWFVYSVSDSYVDKLKIVRNLQVNIYAKIPVDSYADVGEIIKKSIDTDPNLRKRIKEGSEYESRRRQ